MLVVRFGSYVDPPLLLYLSLFSCLHLLFLLLLVSFLLSSSLLSVTRERDSPFFLPAFVSRPVDDFHGEPALSIFNEKLLLVSDLSATLPDRSLSATTNGELVLLLVSPRKVYSKTEDVKIEKKAEREREREKK